MGASGGDIAEELKADVLLATVEGGDVGGTGNEWGVEHGALQQLLVGPSPTTYRSHDLANVGDPVLLQDGSSLFGFAEVFAVGVVEGHYASTPVIRCKAFCPPPTSVSDRVFAPAASSARAACCSAACCCARD